jgi:putative oxidoreductase
MNIKSLFSSNEINKDLGLLIIRVTIGVLMALYGYEKMIHFTEMAAGDFWGKQVSFLGIKGAVPLGLTVFAELFCSIFLIFGVFTRISLFFLAFCMAYIFLVVFPFSFVNKGDNGYELNTAFTYFLIYVGLLFTGPGKYSLDRIWFDKK